MPELHHQRRRSARRPGFGRTMRGPAVLALAVLTLCATATRARLAAATPPRPAPAYVLSLKGIINPLSARYLARGLIRAQFAAATAVILELDTPGGLDSSMRDMTQYILSSRIPVIVYVAPPGARAASAGMFITIAGSVAAMAPGTTIGAAHPVSLSGEQQDHTMMTKVEEDAAAYARSIATLRRHNPRWAERAVRESVSVTADEALKLGVIDVIAPTRADLLREVDGRTVTTGKRQVTLHTQGAPIQEMPMTFLEWALQAIADPNVAYILVTVGMLGLMVELYHPGATFPGVTGAICLVLGLTALGTLPTSWAGFALLVLAMALFIAELFHHGFGVLGAGGIIAFVLGSLLLFVPVSPVSPAMPAVRVNPWLIALMSAILFSAVVLIFRVRMLMWRKSPAFGPEAMVGREGVALSLLNPFGTMRTDSEVWRAEARDAPIKRGEKVRIIRVEGVTLVVERAGASVPKPAAESPSPPPSEPAA